MDKEKALEEVGFLKRLLDMEGSQRIRNGWAFILIGLLLSLVEAAIMGQLLFFKWPLAYSFIALTAFALCCLWLYCQAMKLSIPTAAEKQVWRIWMWTIFFAAVFALADVASGAVNAMRSHNELVKSYLFSFMPPAFTARISLLGIGALIATAVITGRRFFVGLAGALAMVRLLFGFIALNVSMISIVLDALFIWFPYLCAGAYFLWQERGRKGQALHETS